MKLSHSVGTLVRFAVAIRVSVYFLFLNNLFIFRYAFNFFACISSVKIQCS